MHEIQAVVRRLEDNCVWIETDPASSCERCKGGQGCSSVSLSRVFCRSRRQFRVQNTLPLAIGDVVAVGMNEQVVMQAALLAYGVPVVGLIFGAWLGGALWPASADLAGAATGALGFVLAFLVVRYRAHTRLAAPEAQPVILRKISGMVIPVQQG